eukprot:1177779-Prorocentrum_minimum.AAC.3
MSSRNPCCHSPAARHALISDEYVIVSGSTCGPVSQSVSQSVGRLVSQSASQSVNHEYVIVSGSTCGPVSQSVSQSAGPASPSVRQSRVRRADNVTPTE